MLKQKRIWIPILSILVIAMGCGLYYGQKTANQEPIKIYKHVEVEPETTPKPPPPGETAESGHWHGDEWHAEPHEPVEVSEAEVSEPATPAELIEVQGGSDRVNPVNAENAAPGPESSEPTKVSREAFEKWVAWENKYSELRKEDSQAGQALIDAMPATEEEAKRYETDENYRREMDQKFQEAVDKIGDVMRRMREHEAKRVLPPGTPTQ